MALVSSESRCIVKPNERMVECCMGSVAAGPSRRAQNLAGIQKLCAVACLTGRGLLENQPMHVRLFRVRRGINLF